MTFTITYRGRDGALTNEVVEAVNRAECVAECKRRGIAPTSIREGRSGKSAASPNGRACSASARQLRIVIALGVVILVVVGACWWLASHGGRGETAQPAEVQKRAHPVKKVAAQERVPPAKKVMPPVKTNEVHEVPLPPWNDAFMTNREMRVKYSTLFLATTNDSGVVVERYRLPNGKTWRKIVEPPPLFKNISDQAIAMVMSSASGGRIPPVPGLDRANLDDEFVKSLEVPIVINPDDPPRIAALKIAVKEVREEILRLKGEGDKRSVGEMLSEHITLANKQASMQADALAVAKRVRDTDGEAAAEEYVKAVNEHLKSYGVRPIRLAKPRGQESGKEGKSK